MKYRFIDGNGQEYLPDVEQWRPEEGIFNIKSYDVSFPKEKLIKRQSTMWRYKEALPFDNSEAYSQVTLGEGMTPLVLLEREQPNFYVKLDYLMPTGSFKDRGAAVLIAKAVELGAASVIADSSGNAGTAVAAYCARANLDCRIYVPSSTSEKKLAQIEAHGAKIFKVQGSREDTAEAAKKAVEEEKAFYASHVYNPFFYEGTKTFAFEIWEQLDYEVPDKVILPVGNGTLVLGAYIGFQNLKSAGVTDKLPEIIAVQSEGCAPIADAFHSNEKVSLVETSHTQAEGIAIADPQRGDQIIEAVRETKGTIIVAPEQDIVLARKELAGKGFYVEPTTAATYAAYRTYQPQLVDSNELVVLSLCGSGLKK
ncbi:threonine synthase [Halobacillus sp. A5]|uniref:threonine synthase n=1 Tax=Halobacillus sp. A5 TaxID=2880263 RepID=UPI0020A68D0C|nr:threonine synthase [Halobacillus sp. A5]MCP3028518.1 threonine synthase [Halobacillus sp. A5]